MAKKARKKKEASNILRIDSGEAVKADAAVIAELRERMTPTDRENYDKICKAIEISLENGRLSVFPQLIKQKEEIEKRYEQGEDDAIIVTWDDAALSEASGA